MYLQLPLHLVKVGWNSISSEVASLAPETHDFFFGTDTAVASLNWVFSRCVSNAPGRDKHSWQEEQVSPCQDTVPVWHCTLNAFQFISAHLSLWGAVMDGWGLSPSPSPLLCLRHDLALLFRLPSNTQSSCLYLPSSEVASMHHRWPLVSTLSLRCISM